MEKKCSKCLKIKNEIEFHKLKNGECRSLCKICQNNQSLLYSRKNANTINEKRRKKRLENVDEYRKKDKEKRNNFSISDKEKNKKYQEEYRKTNKETLKEYHKKYYLENKEHMIKKEEKYRTDNKDIISEKRKTKEYKEKRNSRREHRKKIDIIYAITCKMRKMLYHCFKSNGYTKKGKSQEILGCSFKEFKEYLESKFESWMTWENRGLYNGELNYGWDIDHIIPLSTAKTVEEVIKLNHYTNLQPLCSYINRVIKKDYLDT